MVRSVSSYKKRKTKISMKRLSMKRWQRTSEENVALAEFVAENEEDPNSSCSVSNKESMEVDATCSQTTEIIPNLPEISQINASHTLPVETCDTNRKKISGRRIIDVEYFFKQLFEIGEHKPFSCNIINMEVIAEKNIGLCSIFQLKCKNCNIIKDIVTDDIANSEKLNINDAAVLSCISTGIGHSQLAEQHAAINLPAMSFYIYNRSHINISEVIRKTAWDSMEAAGKEEAAIAKEEGHVDNNGIPIITVVADGAWCKRSYRTNYNASSGVACIIGQRTGKLLYLGVKNKYCTVCARAENKNETVPLHTCFRNWEGTSTAMESEIILEGFKTSLFLHGLIFKRLVGDGDSSVMKKIFEAKPYGNNLVEKVECRNHLLRNFINKLKELSTKKTTSNNRIIPILQRKSVAENIKRFRAAVTRAVAHRKSEDKSLEDQVADLKRDLLNIPSHIFGEHKDCADLEYFCKKTCAEENSKIKEMKESGLYNEVLYIMYRLINNATSLILDMDNNSAELYNAIVCKYVGGKRINFSLKGGYNTRCEAAAISYNNKCEYLSQVYKTATTRSPGIHTKKYIRRKELCREHYSRRKLFKSKIKKSLKRKIELADEDYGGTPDITEEEYEEKKKIFLKKLEKTPEEQEVLERNTRGQSCSTLWVQERAVRLTASMFGRVCKMLPRTSCANIIKSIIYSNFSGTRATEYGKIHEKVALKEFENKTGLSVLECGLFLHEKYNYLGASPDGLVGEDSILEIKCPASAEKLNIEEAISKKIIKCAKILNGHLKLNEENIYMYQIQGQLQITKKRFCYFIIWTPQDLKFQKIERNDHFWKTKMEPKLISFYDKCMLPELIDPRYTRNMPIRNPPR